MSVVLSRLHMGKAAVKFGAIHGVLPEMQAADRNKV